MSAIAAATLTLDFEAMGFVSTRRSLDALDRRDTPSAEVMFKKVRSLLEPFGFTGVEDVTLSEDDGQDNTDIKVFVVVKLEAPQDKAADIAKTIAHTGIPTLLEEALGHLAKYVCTTARGEDRVGAENWELANSYELD